MNINTLTDVLQAVEEYKTQVIEAINEAYLDTNYVPISEVFTNLIQAVESYDLFNVQVTTDIFELDDE